MDIVIKNGRVYDPHNNIDQIADIAIDNGKIVKIGTVTDEAAKFIDAEGCVVTPGFIDLHTHLWPFNDFGMPAEATCFPSCVTTAVEAGSSGWSNFELNHIFTSYSKLTIRRFVNVSVSGLPSIGKVDEIDLRILGGKGKTRIHRLFEKYPGEIEGLKINVSTEFFAGRGKVLLEETIKLAEELNTRLMVHITEPELPTAEVLSMLRKGDIVSHMYHGRGSSNIIGEDGKVLPEAWAARERGVIFDVANARAHFAFATAEPAMAEGFLPDTISTDLTNMSAYKKPFSFSLPFIMSKFIAMGMSLEQVIDCVTINPANVLNLHDGTGTLTVGKKADVAIIKVLEKDVEFGDHQGRSILGHQLIKPVATIKEGEFVYRDIEF